MAKPNREIAWPFHIGPTGGVAYVEDPVLVAMQRLKQLILTRPGERVMQPGYGSVANSYIFENNDDVVSAELSLRLKANIADWEPTIVIQSVTPAFTNETDGAMTIDVKFSIPPQADVFTATVGVGGIVAGG